MDTLTEMAGLGGTTADLLRPCTGKGSGPDGQWHSKRESKRHVVFLLCSDMRLSLDKSTDGESQSPITQPVSGSPLRVDAN